jgi:hypothetical protein
MMLYMRTVVLLPHWLLELSMPKGRIGVAQAFQFNVDNRCP